MNFTAKLALAIAVASAASLSMSARSFAQSSGAALGVTITNGVVSAAGAAASVDDEFDVGAGATSGSLGTTASVGIGSPETAQAGLVSAAEGFNVLDDSFFDGSILFTATVFTGPGSFQSFADDGEALVFFEFDAEPIEPSSDF